MGPAACREACRLADLQPTPLRSGVNAATVALPPLISAGLGRLRGWRRWRCLFSTCAADHRAGKQQSDRVAHDTRNSMERVSDRMHLSYPRHYGLRRYTRSRLVNQYSGVEFRRDRGLNNIRQVERGEPLGRVIKANTTLWPRISHARNGAAPSWACRPSCGTRRAAGRTTAEPRVRR